MRPQRGRATHRFRVNGAETLTMWCPACHERSHQPLRRAREFVTCVHCRAEFDRRRLPCTRWILRRVQ